MQAHILLVHTAMSVCLGQILFKFSPISFKFQVGTGSNFLNFAYFSELQNIFKKEYQNLARVSLGSHPPLRPSPTSPTAACSVLAPPTPMAIALALPSSPLLLPHPYPITRAATIGR
jgi:hypothetical protein